jgi:tRNA(Arg) A34 adenosine deaminase TadA
MRECYRLAVTSGKKGNHTFGAVLVHGGEIVARAENTEVTGKSYGHAEYNLVAKCIRRLPDEMLADSTLYTSTVPCPRCTFSILAAGIRGVVFGVSRKAFLKVLPGRPRPFSFEELVRNAGIALETRGPILEDEGLKVFQYWEGKFTPLEKLLKSAAEARNARMS